MYKTADFTSTTEKCVYCIIKVKNKILYIICYASGGGGDF
jgi:hypothetical protein